MVSACKMTRMASRQSSDDILAVQIMIKGKQRNILLQPTNLGQEQNFPSAQQQREICALQTLIMTGQSKSPLETSLKCSHLEEEKAGKRLQGASDSARVTLMGTTDPGELPDPPEMSPGDFLVSLQSRWDASI